MAESVSELVDDLTAIVREQKEETLAHVDARFEAVRALADLILEVCEATSRAVDRGEGETARELVAVLDQAHLRLKTLTNR